MGALTHNGEVLQSLPANASQINFDKTGTNLNSTQTENAIKEVNTKANTNANNITQLQSEKADTDIVAADFNAGTSYTAGNYCVQDGKLYKFKNNHSGAWSSADVDEVKITGELSAIKNGLIAIGTLLDGDHNGYEISVDTATTTALGSVALTSGKWLLICSIDWASNNKGCRQVALGKSENPARNAATTTMAVTDTNKETYQQVSRVYEVVTTETVTLYGYQTSGAALVAMPYIKAIKIS